jgi:hypothetical protein
LLLVWGGVGAIFAVDLISFVVALLALVLARFSAPPTDAGVGVGEDGDSPAAVNDTYRLQDAARWVWNHARPIARLIGAMAIINFFLAIFNVSVIARGTILGGEAGAGIAPTVGGVTMLGASLVIAARGIPQRRMQALMLALVAFGCASMLAVAGPSLLLLSVGVGLAMITAPVAQTIVTTTFQEQVKTSMQGRVFGLRNAVGRGTYPLGALVAGPVAARSIPGAFAVVGVAMVLTGAACRPQCWSAAHRRCTQQVCLTRSNLEIVSQGTRQSRSSSVRTRSTSASSWAGNTRPNSCRVRSTRPMTPGCSV